MAWESSFFDSFCSLRQSGFNYYCVRCELLNSFNILSECIDENHQPPQCDQCINQEHAFPTCSECQDIRRAFPGCSTCNNALHRFPSCTECNDSKHAYPECSECLNNLETFPDCSECQDNRHAFPGCSTCNNALHRFPSCTECNDSKHAHPECSECLNNLETFPDCESCQRVTTRDECETLSEQLGLIRTHSYKGNWTHYPPNCFFIDWGHKQALYFNEYQEGNNLPCTADKICVCKNGLLPSGKIHYKWQRFKDQETPLKIFQNLQDHICASKKNPKKTIFSLKQGHQGVWW